MDSNTSIRAAVVTPERVYYSDSVRPNRAGAHLEPHRILWWTQGRMAQHSTVIVEGATVADHTAHADEIRAYGWDFSRIGAWTLYHNGDGRTVAIGLRDEFEPRHLDALILPGDDPAGLAWLLERYHTLTGWPWRGTPATTALAGLRGLYDGKPAPLWHYRPPGELRAAGPLVWRRELTEREQSWGYVHTFDASSAYLGSAGNAELAWSKLEHTGPRGFDRHTPGYWQTQISPALQAWQADPQRPPIIHPRHQGDTVWLTTPMMTFLEEHGFGWTVEDSWTATTRPGHRAGYRVLREFAAQLRDARIVAETTVPRLTDAIKRTYKDATGGMQRETMRVYRPDWAHTLIDLWRATILRRVIDVHASQGVWPVDIRTDSLSYADGGPYPQQRAATRHHGEWAHTLTDAVKVASCEVASCGCSSGRTQLGTYKHAASCTTEKWQRLHPTRTPVGAR